MRGHGTERELEQLERLEALLGAGSISTEELLTLGLLFVEPAHEQKRGIECFSLVLERAPEVALGRIWLAHTLQHFGIDQPSLRRALSVLKPICAEGSSERAAALMLYAWIERELNEGTPGGYIHLMELSVANEPGWISNRMLLADLYRGESRLREAREQIQAALRNIVPLDPAWGVLKENYEVSITWRASFMVDKRLRAALQNLE